MYIHVDLDISDIVSELDRYDRQELFEIFQDKGYIPEQLVIRDGVITLSSLVKGNDDFNNALEKLHDNGWKLTLEEEQYIINLSKRF